MAGSPGFARWKGQKAWWGQNEAKYPWYITLGTHWLHHTGCNHICCHCLPCSKSWVCALLNLFLIFSLGPNLQLIFSLRPSTSQPTTKLGWRCSANSSPKYPVWAFSLRRDTAEYATYVWVGGWLHSVAPAPIPNPETGNCLHIPNFVPFHLLPSAASLCQLATGISCGSKTIQKSLIWEYPYFLKESLPRDTACNKSSNWSQCN